MHSTYRFFFQFEAQSKTRLAPPPQSNSSRPQHPQPPPQMNNAPRMMMPPQQQPPPQQQQQLRGRMPGPGMPGPPMQGGPRMPGPPPPHQMVQGMPPNAVPNHQPPPGFHQGNAYGKLSQLLLYIIYTVCSAILFYRCQTRNDAARYATAESSFTSRNGKYFTHCREIPVRLYSNKFRCSSKAHLLYKVCLDHRLKVARHKSCITIPEHNDQIGIDHQVIRST